LKLTRRAFLGLTASSVLVVAHALVASPDSGALDSIAQVVVSELPFLRLDPPGVRAFARDFVAARPTYAALKRAALFAHLDIFDLAGKQRQLADLKDNIVESYLMSSDFFLHQADETRVVRYLRYYDPQTQSCANPFARFS